MAEPEFRAFCRVMMIGGSPSRDLYLLDNYIYKLEKKADGSSSLIGKVSPEGDFVPTSLGEFFFAKIWDLGHRVTIIEGHRRVLGSEFKGP